MMLDGAEGRGMAMTLGFTGSRKGMTLAQADGVAKFLKEYQPLAVHHGDCLGSDEEFHDMVRELLPITQIIIHPPISNRLRAFCKGDVVMEPKPYLERDMDIVQSAQWVIATPANMIAGTGGTWYTIRYADREKVNHTIFYPNGTIGIMEFEE